MVEDIELARRVIPHTCRIFLADGDVLVLSTQVFFDVFLTIDFYNGINIANF
jgi:hypothetical protein